MAAHFNKVGTEPSTMRPRSRLEIKSRRPSSMIMGEKIKDGTSPFSSKLRRL